jgi:hypothetical protein
MAGTQISTVGRGGGPSALLALLDGLVDRMLKSPLMRRAPFQCGPEEQAAQAALLIDIVNVRSLRAAAEALPTLSQDVVAEHWPDLAAILAPARRPASAKVRPPGAARPATSLGGLYDSLDAEPQEDGQDATPEALTTDTAGSDNEHSLRSEELVGLLREELQASEKAQNTTQMLAWLHERGESATREEVMNALFAREDIFRKRGAGQWTLVGREPHSPA